MKIIIPMKQASKNTIPNNARIAPRNMWNSSLRFIILSSILILLCLSSCATIESYKAPDGKEVIRSYGFPFPPKGKIDNKEVEPFSWPQLWIKD